MSELWYMARGGSRTGPVPADEIESLIRSGSVDSDTYVFTSSIGSWTHARDVPRFARQLGGTAADAPNIPAPPGIVGSLLGAGKRLLTGESLSRLADRIYKAAPQTGDSPSGNVRR